MLDVIQIQGCQKGQIHPDMTRSGMVCFTMCPKKFQKLASELADPDVQVVGERPVLRLQSGAHVSHCHLRYMSHMIQMMAVFFCTWQWNT